MNPKLLSVVIPFFNEEDNIPDVYYELTKVLKRLHAFAQYEIIMVNDGSKDGSLACAKKIAADDHNVKIISFTRNFGHEYATYAGVLHAQGDAVVIMDADNQDPPELINDFEREYRNGYHIVYGQRVKRMSESWLKKITSKAFYPVFNYFTNVDLPPNVGDFCLMSRKAVDYVKQMPEKTIFMRGLIYWSGLSKKSIPFVRRGRGRGVSKYNYAKLTIFALENIISFSTVPIYLIIFLSLAIIALCCMGSALALVMHVCGYVVMTGWTSLIMCMLFLFASTFLFLGILGLYVGKIFQEIKQRPPFLIDEKINFPDEVGLQFGMQAKPAIEYDGNRRSY